MEILEAHEPHRVKRYSSISQYEGMLAVRRGDEWVPVVYDVLDGLNCDHMLSHKAMLARKSFVGYNFPVKECTYVSERILAHTQKGTELRALPEWYGTGFYEADYDRKVLTNAENGALGVTNKMTLRVGLDYVIAHDHLDPADKV